MTNSFHHPTPSLGEQTASVEPLYQRRGAPETGHSIELLPNPDFVFPAQSSEASPSLDNWNALNRRPQSSQQNTPLPSSGPRTHRSRGSAALPDFVFNPSAASASASRSLVTPPHSPILPSPTTPSRALGHRRGGSEFIGGDGKGGAGLMSTSPTKGDVALPVSSTSGRLGPPAGARGHRHRRSGAISCHDLQAIMAPKESMPGNRGGSAPATPLEGDTKPFFAHPQRRVASQADFRSSPEATRTDSTDSPPRAVPRVRVGFSDRVEYIRPLSTISSETESSLSTIRGHSVSNSLSSVISLSASSPPSSRVVARLPLQTTFEGDRSTSRPQSSGDVLDVASSNKQEFHVQWDSSNNERPKSAASTPASECPPSLSASTESKSPKRRSFGWWESKKPTHVLRSSISEPSLLPSPPTSPDSVESTAYAALGEELSNANVEKQPKSKKSKSWTRSFISRKSRSHGNLKTKPIQGRAPTPPPLSNETPAPEMMPSPANAPAVFDVEDTFEPNFDIDETVTIVTEEPRPNLSLTPLVNRLHADSDPMSPVIDLDAALGPFRTPQFGANSRGSPAKSQPRPRRSMHSLGYQASLNHRRTESAPELVPFELRNTKLTPTTTMPDVFEEEDEEAAEEAVAPSKPSAAAPTIANDDAESAPGIKADDLKDDAETPTRKPSQLIQPTSAGSAASGIAIMPSMSSQRVSSAVEVVQDHEEPRASSLGRDSDSTITPPLTAEDEKAPRPLMNLQLPHPSQALMTPDTLTASSFSSRHFSNSQVSLSTPRLGTATSSMTDNRSISFGDAGPPVRMSVDDVPSLSSSRSTMTTPPQFPFMFGGSYGSSSEGRKSSVASIPSLDEARRRSKRASVASLSRLVGVKSKLSIETRPQSQHIMSTSMSPVKTKKTNRLSKLMHFWKKQPSGSRRGSLA
ncbi:uncharacterized protein PV09_05195 [Verruconis gallopava]|uniref:Cell wall proline rich protein n=1 Tax=Verruconis gallopava TaxID=253628 RepID=A0A0D2A9K0_9PEZI|nr:uncharacterized protein PV09_05195 [Verruconis gallopava]KIW03423.1 hypothetical protein PV09_05195 [Verruconis gallopava]